MKHESCFTECSPYLAPYEDRSTGYYFTKVPICSDWADRWFDACKDDFTCVDDFYGSDWDYNEEGFNICKPTATCTKYKDRFQTPKRMLESIWGVSFTYSTDKTKCYSPWFVGTDANEKVYYNAVVEKVKREDPGNVGTFIKTVAAPQENRLPKSINVQPFPSEAAGKFKNTVDSAQLPSGATSDSPLDMYTEIQIDHDRRQVFAVDSVNGKVSVFNLDNINAGPTGSIDIRAQFAGFPLSIALMEQVLAVTIAPRTWATPNTWFEDATNPGTIAFYASNNLTLLSSTAVGSYPVKVVFTPNGELAVVANKGYKVRDGLDPIGSVSLVSVRPRRVYAVGQFGPYIPPNLQLSAANVTAASVKTTIWHNATIAIDPRFFQFVDPANPTRDMEPVWVTITADSADAYVTFQRQNAFGVISLTEGYWTRITSFGYKDHQLDGFGFDGSSTDGVNIVNYPIFGLYQPSAMEIYYADGVPRLVTLNGGDSSRNSVRLSTLTLQNTEQFEDPSVIRSQIGDLLVHSTLGKLQNGNNEFVYSFGARSFSIWQTNGLQIFDSGDRIERLLSWIAPNEYNSVNGTNFDSASTDRGCLLRGINFGNVGDRLYMFAGFENCNGVVVYDVTVAEDTYLAEYLPLKGAYGVTSIQFTPAVLTNTTYETPKVVVSLGSKSSAVQVFEITTGLDHSRFTVPVLQEWGMAQPLLSARADFTANAVGDRIFIAGGCIADNVIGDFGQDICTSVSGTVEIYTPETNSWVNTDGQMRNARTRHAAAVWRGRLYVFGGRPAGDDFGQALDSVEYYDFEVDAWYLVSPMPIALSDACAAELFDKIYVFGGWDSEYTGSLNLTLVYDPSADTWTTLTSAPLNGAIGRGDHSSSVISGKIYTFGGYGQRVGTDWATTVALNTLEIFDPYVGTWVPGNPMNVPRGDAAVAVLGDKMYIIGGEGKTTTDPDNWRHIARNDVESYDPQRDEWIVLDPIPSFRLRGAAATIGDNLFVFGGHNQQKEVLYLSEKYNFQTTLSFEDWVDHVSFATRSQHNYIADATSKESRWVAEYTFDSTITEVHSRILTNTNNQIVLAGHIADTNMTVNNVAADLRAVNNSQISLQQKVDLLTLQLNTLTQSYATLTATVNELRADLERQKDTTNSGDSSNAKGIAIAALILTLLCICLAVFTAYTVFKGRRSNIQRGPVKLENDLHMNNIDGDTRI